jgi:predicted metal-binding membrane protein
MTLSDHPRALTFSGVLALCTLAWVYLWFEAAGMSEMAGMAGMSGMSEMAGGAGMGSRWTPTEWGYLCVMWSIMMVAMMLPSALPAILLMERVAQSRRERSAGGGAVSTTPLFVAGYLASWTGYSVLAATVQWALHGTLLVSDSMTSASPVLSGSLLVGAGVFQLSPLKNRCVTHCRSPLSFLMSHWREGTWGAFRMGVGHGTYCVGCCWALMALLFVLGVMNLIWVTILAAIVLLEKTLPAGRWMTGGLGAALVVWGVVVLLQVA